MKRQYETTQTLAGKSGNPVKDKTGTPLTCEAEQRSRWAERFEEILNRAPPPETLNIPSPADQLNVNTNPPTKADIIKAIKSTKSGKAAGPDDIPPEALTSDITSAEMLHPLLRKIWEKE